jgi:hypothetical protein
VWLPELVALVFVASLLVVCMLSRDSVSRISSPPSPSGQRRRAWVGGLLRRSLSCRCMSPDVFRSVAHR